MSNTVESPYAQPPGDLTPVPGPPAHSGKSALVAAAGSLAGCVAVGLAGGLVWAVVAPKPVYVVVSHNTAYAVNAETSAFITGDLWFCLVGIVGGLVIGVAGYCLAIRKYGPAPMAAVLAGSVVAGLAARWVGQNFGLAEFDNKLRTSHLGTLLHAPLVLGAEPSAIVWPAIAFWPLAACIVPATLLLLGALRDRTVASRQDPLP